MPKVNFFCVSPACFRNLAPLPCVTQQKAHLSPDAL